VVTQVISKSHILAEMGGAMETILFDTNIIVERENPK